MRYRALVRRPVTAQFLKNPDITHWGFDAFRLGEDSWGDWIALPQGSKRWKGAEIVRPSRETAVFCVPRGQWWHLHYNGPGVHRYVLFIDIVTPPVWVSKDRYEMIDLDLDVGMTNDGEVVVEDEDEFQVHQVEFAYSDEMIRNAEKATDQVVAMLENRQEPFFEVAESWLQMV